MVLTNQIEIKHFLKQQNCLFYQFLMIYACVLFGIRGESSYNGYVIEHFFLIT